MGVEQRAVPKLLCPRVFQVPPAWSFSPPRLGLRQPPEHPRSTLLTAGRHDPPGRAPRTGPAGTPPLLGLLF